KPAPEYMVTGVLGYEDGYQAAEYFLTLPNPPDFIFANSDNIAAGIFQYYRNQQQPIPTKVGQENEEVSRLMNITMIDHHYDEVGKNAVDLVINKKVQHIPVSSEFIRRTGQVSSI